MEKSGTYSLDDGRVLRVQCYFILKIALGAKGKWRDQPLQTERTIPHYPEQCSDCDAPLGVEQRDEKPHGGYYQFELNRQGQSFSIECQLHDYYGATCTCGHHSQAKPGQGDCSEVEGRKVQC